MSETAIDVVLLILRTVRILTAMLVVMGLPSNSAHRVVHLRITQ